jgi:hypothetical protein
MHYISNDWKLGTSQILSHKLCFVNIPTEELLIDFREIQGEHTGENMAQTVWETMELYGLKGRVSSYTLRFSLLTSSHIVGHSDHDG